MKLLGGGVQLVCGRPTLALSPALVPQTLSCLKVHIKGVSVMVISTNGVLTYKSWTLDVA